MTLMLLTLIGGLIIGILGGLLGVGGGVLWVPYLVIVVGLRPVEAVGIALFCVIGTCVAGTRKGLLEGRTNVPLALSLEPFMLVGAVLSSYAAYKVSDGLLLSGFSLLLMGIAVLFLSRSHFGQEAQVAPSGPAHFTDGAFYEKDGSLIAYQVDRRKTLSALVFTSGLATGFFGVGGGVLNVPWMHLISKVPLRAAAATSTFTMAITGAAAGAVHFSQGEISGHIVAAALLGVIPGGRLGDRLLGRLPEHFIRWIFAGLLFFVGGITALKAAGVI
jgi:uncharacterized protein